ncbi:unknown [Choristoneura fumiferana DEF multiple nucleopolyhedrovirus]|uniref:Viral desmoplakin N-terminal domain-containing protein n=1 Tax=Choristoneura fumiferana defective polyhedrosis virus TaxID=74660 RepID=Q6VTS7_NPVCD|nr:hypothetical protein CFDNVgORF62 [Choristoneura fumiferana DEF multiple nucleopolyhedrovirus]AAQ91641.1 unknown [Choristoneura fumiferana DEF multiple nucleopolyhedrovirus]
MQKYGATDVSSRTVHDLLTTINTMSLRIKSLERYEHALREIHKVIIMMRPGFNLQLMDLNAMPALIVQFFSDMTGRDITHNINYKYDYNFNGALPFQAPPPQPFYGEHGLQQPPPQPPFQPPPQPPSQQPPPQPPSQQPPPQPPSQQPQPPPQQPPPQPPPQQPPCQTIVPQIELTVDEMRELQNVYQNMQQQTITWDHLGVFVTTMVRIMQVRVINSVTIVNAINSLQNVTILTNFDFNDFLRCVARETALQFTISLDLCRIIVAFIQFFQNTYFSITLTLFTYVNLDGLIVSTNSMHVIIVQLYEFFTKIYFLVMQTRFVYTNSDGFVQTTAMLYSRVEALTASAQTTTVVSSLQEELRKERIKVNNLDREKNSALQSASDYENRYKNVQSENENLKTQVERLTPLENESRTLTLDKEELLSENNRLKEANAKLQNDNTELLKRSAQNFENFKNEQIKVKEEQEKSKDLERRLQNVEDLQTQNVNNDAQDIIFELRRNLKEKENQLQEAKTSNSTALSKLQFQIDSDAATYRAKLASMEQEFNKTINERNNTINQLNEALVAAKAQYDELITQLEKGQQELNNTNEYEGKKFGDDTDKIIEFALTALDLMYKRVREIDPNLGNGVDLSQNPNNMNLQLAEQQRDLLNNWFVSLNQTMATNDILNFNSVLNMASVKNQIAHIIPANMLLGPDGNLMTPQQVQNADNVVLISAVSTLVSEYNRLAGEVFNLTANSAAQSEASALIANCSQQIAALQEELRKNKEDFKKINNLVQTSSPQLNDKTIQSMKTELDTAKSQINNLKKATTEQLKQMADNGVQVEMSKLNTQIDKINSLLLHYRSVTQDIFDWKTNMMELYESLARTTAEMETI